MSVKFMKDAAERAVMAFLTGWLGSAMATGFDFDALSNTENLKIGATAMAISVAAAIGLKKVGPNKESGSVF